MAAKPAPGSPPIHTGKTHALLALPKRSGGGGQLARPAANPIRMQCGAKIRAFPLGLLFASLAAAGGAALWALPQQQPVTNSTSTTNSRAADPAHPQPPGSNGNHPTPPGANPSSTRTHGSSAPQRPGSAGRQPVTNATGSGTPARPHSPNTQTRATTATRNAQGGSARRSGRGQASTNSRPAVRPGARGQTRGSANHRTLRGRSTVPNLPATPPAQGRPTGPQPGLPNSQGRPATPQPATPNAPPPANGPSTGAHGAGSAPASPR